MARKPRDHAAEYRRQKEIARMEGYRSPAARKRAHRSARQAETPRGGARVSESRSSASERRVRDHAAEYARRQELARQRGYSGAWEEKRRKRAVKGNQNRLSKEWSDRRSRQAVTQYDEGWSQAQKDAYYKAFVKWDNLIPHDERDFSDIYDYMIEYGDWDAADAIDDPYRKKR